MTSPAITGEAAVEMLKGNLYRHRTWPVSACFETRPDSSRKMIWRTLAKVVGTGEAWVIFSFSPFQSSPPLTLSKASSDSPGPPPPTYTALPSTTAEAALPHLLIELEIWP